MLSGVPRARLRRLTQHAGQVGVEDAVDPSPAGLPVPDTRPSEELGGAGRGRGRRSHCPVMGAPGIWEMPLHPACPGELVLAAWESLPGPKAGKSPV